MNRSLPVFDRHDLKRSVSHRVMQGKPTCASVTQVTGALQVLEQSRSANLSHRLGRSASHQQLEFQPPPCTQPAKMPLATAFAVWPRAGLLEASPSQLGCSQPATVHRAPPAMPKAMSCRRDSTTNRGTPRETRVTCSTISVASAEVADQRIAMSASTSPLTRGLRSSRLSSSVCDMLARRRSRRPPPSTSNDQVERPSRR